MLRAPSVGRLALLLVFPEAASAAAASAASAAASCSSDFPEPSRFALVIILRLAILSPIGPTHCTVEKGDLAALLGLSWGFAMADGGPSGGALAASALERNSFGR